MLRVSVIVNPNAGPARRRRPPREAVALAEGVIRQLGAEPRVIVASGPGTGREAARQEMTRGTDVVCAWGGDGTINEIAGAVTDCGGVLAIVPAGSGNGLARDLGVPGRPDQALRIAVEGIERRIDTGDVNGRRFFNIAGLGLDARIAHDFASTAGRRRGLWPYVRAAVGGLFGHVPARYTVTVDGAVNPAVTAMMITVANSRQWGNGAMIAPAARLDDGRLDVVVLSETRPFVIAARMWRLLAGTIDRAPGITSTPGASIRVTVDRDVALHLDGEPAGRTRSADIRVHPGSLRVRVPAQGRAVPGHPRGSA